MTDMNKKYAIFDMDGTLVDSMKCWQNVALEYLDSRNIPKELQTEELLERIKTQTIHDTAVLSRELFDITESIDSIVDEIYRIMAVHYRSDIQLKAGVQRYLSILKAQGVKMCVASATGSSLIDICLSRLGIRDCFDFLLSCEDVGKSKDHPDVYLEASRRLGAASSHDVAVFEDSLAASITARSAGFVVVGVYDECSESDWEQLSQLAEDTVTDWTAYSAKSEQ